MSLTVIEAVSPKLLPLFLLAYLVGQISGAQQAGGCRPACQCHGQLHGDRLAVWSGQLDLQRVEASTTRIRTGGKFGQRASSLPYESAASQALPPACRHTILPNTSMKATAEQAQRQPWVVVACPRPQLTFCTTVCRSLASLYRVWAWYTSGEATLVLTRKPDAPPYSL